MAGDDDRSMDDHLEGRHDNPRGQVPRKSSDILTERLIQIRHRADEAERQREQAVSQNRELREQVRMLRESLDQRLDHIQEQVTDSSDSELLQLRRELELVRTRAATDLDGLRQKLLESSQAQNDTRNVELEAEIQALRQETALLRNSVKEKDKTLEDLATQCRGLEDVLEDRDREMDRLQRDLEQSRAQHDSPPPPALRGGRHESPPPLPHAFQDNHSSEVLDGSNLIYVPDERKPSRIIALAVIGALLLGIAVALAIYLFRDRGTVSPAAPTPASETPRPPAATRPNPRVTAAPAHPTAPTATKATAAPAAPRSLRDHLRDGSLGPIMVHIPAGSFIMGSRVGLSDRDAQPAHRVTLGGFWMGRYEVTFAEYDHFARATGRPLPDDAGWGRGRRPVINVSWNDAVAYARWLTEQTGARYRLPSEAEWEYAARGGSNLHYWWGYTVGNNNAVCFDCGSRWDKLSTAPVGSLKPNAYGLYDTAGNVMEWVQDCHNPNYRGAPADGRAWLSGDCSQRVNRGGAYNKPSGTIRSDARNAFPEDARFDMLGFRLVREE